MSRLTPKQRSLLDFLHEWFSDGEGPISVVELADATCFNPQSMSLTMYSLSASGYVEMAKTNGLGGMGSAHVILSVHHPNRGAAKPERIVFDELAFCYRFASDMQPTVKRTCLACGSGFEAPSRFIRFCETCKTSEHWQLGADGGEYLSNSQAILTNRVGGFHRARRA